MTKNYVFDFESTRISISSLTIRRRLDSTAFCSVTLPDPEPYSDLIAANPNGTLTLKQIIDGGSEVTIGTYTLEQILTTKSPTAFTVVLNGTADFGTDQSSSGSYTITNPITTSSDSNGTSRFSAEENGLIVVGDTINLSDNIDTETTAYTVEDLSLFVNTANSRMDIGIV